MYITRPSLRVGRYKMIKHKLDKGNDVNPKRYSKKKKDLASAWVRAYQKEIIRQTEACLSAWSHSTLVVFVPDLAPGIWEWSWLMELPVSKQSQFNIPCLHSGFSYGGCCFRIMKRSLEIQAIQVVACQSDIIISEAVPGLDYECAYSSTHTHSCTAANKASSLSSSFSIKLTVTSNNGMF